MKVYIAAPFFNPEQLELVESVERRLHNAGISYFSPRDAGVLKDMTKEKQMQTKKEIYDGNVREMDACSHMIAIVEYKDTGTTFEIGYYAAQKKPIILFANNIEKINVMLAEGASALVIDSFELVPALFGNAPKIHPEEVQ